MSATRLVLVVDGGGTTTTACLASLEDGNPVVQGLASADQSNPAVVGLDVCRASIEQAARAALAAADVPASVQLDHIVIGLAGIEATDQGSQLEQWARQRWSTERAEVVTDIELLLMAAADDRATVGLISGTGSVCVGRATDGRMARAGGRGFLTGDVGSGFWIGQQGVTAAIRALDHIGPPTLLIELVAQRMGSRDPAAWTNHIYAADQDPRSVLASYTPLVFQAAAQQDAVATEIVTRAGNELATLVQGVVHQLDLNDRQYDLVFAGGVLINQPSIREQLADRLEQVPLRPLHEVHVSQPAQSVAEQLCRGRR